MTVLRRPDYVVRALIDRVAQPALLAQSDHTGHSLLHVTTPKAVGPYVRLDYDNPLRANGAPRRIRWLKLNGDKYREEVTMRHA